MSWCWIVCSWLPAQLDPLVRVRLLSLACAFPDYVHLMKLNMQKKPGHEEDSRAVEVHLWLNRLLCGRRRPFPSPEPITRNDRSPQHLAGTGTTFPLLNPWMPSFGALNHI